MSEMEIAPSLSTRKDALQNQESHQYDGNGTVTQFTDRRSKVATFSYDGLNRRTFAGYGTTAGPAYKSSVTYTYDSGNRLTQVADTAGFFGNVGVPIQSDDPGPDCLRCVAPLPL